MNKKYLIFPIIFLFVYGALSAQTFDFRHYSDVRNGFRGVATAIFIDNISDVDLEDENFDLDERMWEFFDEMFESRGRNVDRITRNNHWLAQQALNEWNLEERDIFLVLCAENMRAETILVMLVLIDANGEDFAWWGRVMSTRDFD